MSTFFFPDLTKQPPRSPRVRLGGYVILPRMLDKCRATIAGKNGEYHYNCPMDQNFLCFTGIDPEKLKEQAAKGLGDGEILEWITANAPIKRCEWEIAQWSDYMAGVTASDVETREFFSGELAKLSRTREDIYTWADLLDLDDYVSFGGKA
jgi:hypothetical protein